MVNYRGDQKYGTSTLQGGGGVDIEEIHQIIDQVSLPDLDIEWRAVGEDYFYCSNDIFPFGQIFDESQTPQPPFPARVMGTQLPFALPAIRDPYGLAQGSIWSETLNFGMSADESSLKGEDHDFRRGVFRLGAIVETNPVAIGERGLAFLFQTTDFNAADGETGIIPSGEFIIFDQAVLPTTAVRSTLAMQSPELYLDFDVFKTQVKDYWAGQGYTTSPIADQSAKLSLYLHQTSGEDLPVTYTRMWIKKVRDWPREEVEP